MTNNHSPEKPSIITRIARILGILFAIFISLFALDVFAEGTPFWQSIAALFIHLIPTYILLVILWVAWKRPLIGGPLYILLGLAYIIIAKNQILITYLLIAGIPMLISALFISGYFFERRPTA